MSSPKRKRWGKFSRERESGCSSSESEQELSSSNQSESSIEDRSYGPSLPTPLTKPIDSTFEQKSVTGFNQSSSSLKKDENIFSQIKKKSKSSCESVTKSLIGPAIPSHLLAKESAIEDNEDNFTDFAGPPLPPNFKNKEVDLQTFEKKKVFGPTIPQHLIEKMDKNKEATSLASSSSWQMQGPAFPPDFIPPIDSSSDDDCNIGPDPRLMSTGEAISTSHFDERASRAKRKLLGLDKEEKKERESWMTELPPERAGDVGLGPRQFRQKLAPDLGDRSVWTDTPSDTIKKEKMPMKVDDKTNLRKKGVAERDRMMEKLARKAEKKLKREESLLDMHRKKIKKKAKEEEKKAAGQPKERKRFNREEDLQVNRFDEAQKKAIFKRAQLLNDRFSRGESKYL